MDDDQSKHSEECTDQSSDQWAPCIPGFNPLLTQTGSTYGVYREALTLTVDPPLNVKVKQLNVVDGKTDDSVPVVTPNEVYPREETLSYKDQSEHKVFYTITYLI